MLASRAGACALRTPPREVVRFGFGVSVQAVVFALGCRVWGVECGVRV